MRASAAIFAAIALQATSNPVFSAEREPASNFATYVAQPGDTLYSVAERYLRDPADWHALSRLNRVAAPRRLQPGTKLRIPPELLKREPLALRVVATSGQVTRAFERLPPVPVRKGMALSEGDLIRTGADGFITVEFDDGTHVGLPPDSSASFSTLNRTVLTGATHRIVQLRKGEVASEVTHAKERDDRFEVHAPTIVAGVRGTRFSVSYGQRAAAVEVLDGAVAVDKTAASGSPKERQAAFERVRQTLPAQFLAAGYGSVTPDGGAVGAPVPLLPAPALEHPAKTQDGAEAAFDIVPLEGASRYRVMIARDAGAIDLIRDQRVDTPHASFSDLDDGTYFVRLSAIDEYGLEGRPAVYAFERRRNAVSASAARVAGSRDYRFRWLVGRPGVATHFRFILARDEALEERLVDAVDIAGDEFVVSGLPAGVYHWTVVAEQFENGRFYETPAGVRSFTLAY
ncbi:peptidase M23 [Trinickia caryophylli]|nr:peptidase M23 [Trinickia caryophylli]